MFNKILVPLDGSTLAECAIPHAEQFARIFGSTIILFQVLDPTSFHENPNAVDPLSWQIRKTEADMYMSGVADRLRNNLQKTTYEVNGVPIRQDIKVEYALREGKTAENIVNFAHAEDIDLLIISSHGSGGLSRWNISSVTQKVITLIYLPVLIIRGYNLPETENATIHYRHILLPIDSSRRAECSLSAGIALVRGGTATVAIPEVNNKSSRPSTTFDTLPESKLILAAVIKPPELPIPEPYPFEIKKISDDLVRISRQVVREYLSEMKERLSVPCETCVIENNSVATAIQDLAIQDDKIDLVVLCAHGYTGQSSWPYGSVARNYIEHGTKPVLVIQDVSHSHVQPTAAEIAAEKSGGR